MLTFLCEIAVLETLGSFCQVRAQIPSWSLICPGGATGSTCPIRGKKVFPCQWDVPSASSVVVLAAMDSHSSRTEDLGHPASTRAPNPCTSSRWWTLLANSQSHTCDSSHFFEPRQISHFSWTWANTLVTASLDLVRKINRECTPFLSLRSAILISCWRTTWDRWHFC